MKHFPISQLRFQYENIFVYCTRDSLAIEDSKMPSGFKRCTIGDRLKLGNIIYIDGRIPEGQMVWEFECPSGYMPVAQYQPNLDITFFALVRY